MPPSRTEILDDLYTSTWNNRRKEVVDQFFNASPFYQALRSKGGIKFNGEGGRYLEVPLSYARNETVTSLGRGDTISLSDTAFLSVAQFEWKFVAGNVTRFFTDDAKNKSMSAHLNLANSKIDNLRDSMIDHFETMLFADGTGNGSKDMNGLANLVSSTPTASATVGNINQSTYSWWQNRQKTSSGAASVYLLGDMRNLANTCSEGQTRKFPNMLVTTQTVAELYDDEVLEQRSIVNKSAGDAEFLTTTWKGIPLIWSGQCPSGAMYMLNSQYIALNIDPAINFMATEWKTIPNQLDRVMQIVVKGELVTTRRKSLGVLTSIA